MNVFRRIKAGLSQETTRQGARLRLLLALISFIVFLGVLALTIYTRHTGLLLGLPLFALAIPYVLTATTLTEALGSGSVLASGALFLFLENPVCVVLGAIFGVLGVATALPSQWPAIQDMISKACAKQNPSNP